MVDNRTDYGNDMVSLFSLTGQEKREIEHVCIWNPMATDLLRKH